MIGRSSNSYLDAVSLMQVLPITRGVIRCAQRTNVHTCSRRTGPISSVDVHCRQTLASMHVSGTRSLKSCRQAAGMAIIFNERTAIGNFSGYLTRLAVGKGLSLSLLAPEG